MIAVEVALKKFSDVGGSAATAAGVTIALDVWIGSPLIERAIAIGLPIKELITHTYPLDKLNEAMEMNVSQQGIKICYVAD